MAIYGVACAAAGALIYGSLAASAGRAKQSLLYRNNPCAEYSFQDPYGLSIDKRLSSEGKIETYLVHDQSRKEHLLSKDMMPETEAMVAALTKRIYTMNKQDQKKTLDDVAELHSRLSKM